MACEYCRYTKGHDYRCPNYIPPKASYYCSICDEGIYPGEEYIVNPDGEYAHYECLDNMFLSDFVQWYGGEVKTMEDEDG
jgi:hypothetical protein